MLNVDLNSNINYCIKNFCFSSFSLISNHSNGRLKISSPMGGSRLLTTNIDGRRLLTTTDQNSVPVLDLAPNSDSGSGVAGSGRASAHGGGGSANGGRMSGGWGSQSGGSVEGSGVGGESFGESDALVQRPLSRKLEEYAEIIEDEMIEHIE